MNQEIPATLKRLVKERANEICEYCQYPKEFAFFSFHIDHIVSQKHGGITEEQNLAYSCPTCNGHKGSDIASILPPEQAFIRLYNPRIDKWNDHFQWSNFEIIPKTKIGEATVKILQLNSVNRLIERQILSEIRNKQ